MIWEPLLVNEKPHSTVTVTHEILKSVDPVPEARGGGGGGGVGTLELMFQDPSPPPSPPPRVYKQQKSL